MTIKYWFQFAFLQRLKLRLKLKKINIKKTHLPWGKGIKNETSVRIHNITAGATKFCNTNSDFLPIISLYLISANWSFSTQLNKL